MHILFIQLLGLILIAKQYAVGVNPQEKLDAAILMHQYTPSSDYNIYMGI